MLHKLTGIILRNEHHSGNFYILVYSIQSLSFFLRFSEIVGLETFQDSLFIDIFIQDNKQYRIELDAQNVRTTHDSTKPVVFEGSKDPFDPNVYHFCHFNSCSSLFCRFDP